jgi:lysophospholipase L1-like esterase
METLLHRLFLGVSVISIVSMGLAPRHSALAAGRDERQIWVGTWAASPQPAGDLIPTPSSLEDQTIRQIIRTSIGGERVRVSISNAFGAESLTIDAASIGIRDQGSHVAPGTLADLSFGGAPSIKIPAGAKVLSDPVDLAVSAEDEVAISLYVAGFAEASTVHADGVQTSYISTPGDYTASEAMSVAETTTSRIWLSGVEVVAPRTTSVVVAIGDSITDGNRSTVDANARWPDELARRLNDARKESRKVAVLNAGIGGNRLLHDFVGQGALARLDRDVLSQTGVTHVVLLEGINDIGFPELIRPDEEVSAAEIIAGIKQIVERAHARGLLIYGGTLTPFKGSILHSETTEAKRQAVNDWIRTSGTFDGVIDFDLALRDPSDPLRLLPRYDSGDSVHPSDAGYGAMADAVDLSLFRQVRRKR